MRALVAPLCAALVGLSGAARADDADDALDRGRQALRSSDVQKAYREYRAAFDASPRYDTAANLGLVELDLKRSAEAAAHLAFALVNFPEDGDPALRAALRAKLNGELAPYLATVSIAVKKDGAPFHGAEVDVDGVMVGRAPLEPVLLAPGEHRFEARTESSHDAITRTVTAGQPDVVNLEPRPIARVAGAYASVVAGGALLSAAALALGAAFTADAVLLDKSANERVAALQQANGGRQPCDTQPNQDLCNEITAFQNKRDQVRIGAIVGFVGAGLLLGGTIGYAVAAAPKKEPAHAARVAPWVGPDGAGLTLGASF